MRLCIDVILGVNFITSGVLDAVSLLFMLIVDKRKRRERRGSVRTRRRAQAEVVRRRREGIKRGEECRG